MKPREQLGALLTSLKDLRVALEGHVAQLQAKAETMTQAHVTAASHLQVMHTAQDENLKVYERMFNWFVPTPDDV